MDNRRVFTVVPPEHTAENISQITTVHDGIHLELFYNLIFDKIHLRLPNHLRPVVTALGDKNIKSLMVIIAPGLGKALHPDTIICTSTGWKKIKNIEVGNRVYSIDGQLCTVIGKYNQPSSQLYKVTFADGRNILTNKGHLWSVYNKKFLKYGADRSKKVPDSLHYRVRTTEELSHYLSTGKSSRWYIPLSKPINYPVVELPLHPYILGCLLGDGHIGDNGFPIFTSFDSEIVERIRTLGGDLSIYKTEGTFGVKGVCSILKDLKLAGSRSWNKSIPEIYKYASIEQRFELVQGLLDTDGTVSTEKSISFSSSSEQLALDVQEIIRSLGGIAKISSKVPWYKNKKGTKVICKKSYRVGIRFPDPEKLFFLKRKVVRALPTQYSEDLKLEISNIEPDITSDSICIMVDHPSALFIAKDYIATHNSQLLSIAYPLWELGHDHNLTILGVSSGADLMMGFLQSAMTIIDENEVYNLIFPETVPDKNQGWSTAKGIFVKRTAGGIPDPSFTATGYGAKSITGKHAKLLIIDDIQDTENSSSSEQIEKVENFYYNTLLGRRDPMGARMIMVGRRWATDDLYGRLKESKDWLVMTLAAIRDTPELYYDVRIPAGLSCVFNDFTPSTQVEDIKVVYGENHDPVGYCWNDPLMISKFEEANLNKKNKPSIFETVYQSNPSAAESKPFREEDFQDFPIPPELSIGRNYDTVAEFLHQLDFSVMIQCWDTAYTAKMVNDPSVGYTLGLRGCETNHRQKEGEEATVPFHYDIYVLDELYERLEYGDLQQAVIDYYHKWNPNYVIMENATAGIPLIGALQAYSIQVVGVPVQHTSKLTRATDGAKAGSVQGWARQGRIWIPRAAGWSAGLLNELKDFTGARNKKDDRVDSLIHGVNWAIDFGIQSRELSQGWRTSEDIDKKIQSWAIQTNPIMTLPSLYQNVQNPYYNMCGSCVNYDGPKNWCKLLKHTTIKIGSCPFYDPQEGQEQVINVVYGEPEK